MEDAIFIIMPIFCGVVFVAIFTFSILMFLSPKLRGKFMSKQVKAMKHMVDESKDDLENITSTMMGVQIRGSNRAIDENQDAIENTTANIMGSQYRGMSKAVSKNKGDIENVSTTMAKATKKGVKTTTKAVAEGLKEGFTGEETIYCKHCGETIDADSKFCKKCGKEQ